MDEEVAVPALTPVDETLALLVAMTVRNALEDFHVDHLSDAQMAILNPIIRDAVATALHARTNALAHRAAELYLDFQGKLIPEYWEAPRLLDEYVEYWSTVRERDDVCSRCGRRIVDAGVEDQPRWVHLGADGSPAVGCRAATFLPGRGWDESLDRRWKARP